MQRIVVVAALLACAACSSPAREQEAELGVRAAAGQGHGGAAAGSGGEAQGTQDTAELAGPQGTAAPGGAGAAADHGPRTDLPPNELGRIPILEYHLVGRENSRWMVTPQKLREDLELLWSRGYRPVSLQELVDRSYQLPAGTSPVVITFDDASPGQFRYLERGGGLVVDPASAVGVLLEFARTHPGWRNRAVFCLLSGAEAGRSFFGDKGIEGQKTEWRQRKVAFLAEQGFELCNHTLWHATLSRFPDAQVQEQIARLQLAVDSATPGYRIRSFALPLGVWPRHRELARQGAWTDAKTGKRISYRHDAILLVAGEPARSPFDSAFNPLALPRVQMQGDALRQTLDRLDHSRARYVSDGDPERVAESVTGT